MAINLNGTLKGAMVGAPLRFISKKDGKEYITLSKITRITQFNSQVSVRTEDGYIYLLDK